MRLLKLPFSLPALAALMLGLLSACTTAVVVDDPGPYPADPGFGPGPRVCTREYDPVCGRRGPTVRTFGNDCQAEAAGYRVIRGGQCGPDRPPPRDPVCTREYDPVCARRGGNRQTFSNACLAEQAGYRVTRGGECRDEIGDNGPPDDGGFCTREYAPVCARRGPSVRTFGNACEARNAEYRVITDGPC